MFIEFTRFGEKDNKPRPKPPKYDHQIDHRLPQQIWDFQHSIDPCDPSGERVLTKRFRNAQPFFTCITATELSKARQRECLYKQLEMDSAYYTASLTTVLKQLPKYKKVQLPFLENPRFKHRA